MNYLRDKKRDLLHNTLNNFSKFLILKYYFAIIRKLIKSLKLDKFMNQFHSDAMAEKPGLANLKFCIGSQEGQQKITSILDSKDWRKYVTPELRDHLVQRL